MKPMICTSRRGTRSRSSPASRSRGSVVAARVRLASTPSVPLASSAQAAEQAGLADRDAEHLDLRAGGDERHQQREHDERHLDDHPLEEVRRRHPADRDDARPAPAGSRRRRRTSRRGVATTSEHEAEQRQHLEVRRGPVHRRVAVEVQLVAVPGAHVSAAVLGGLAARRATSLGAAAADDEGEAAGEREDDERSRPRRRRPRTAGRRRRPSCRSRRAGCRRRACSVLRLRRSPCPRRPG